MKNNKKKFSIILSIATLCLCFSILAFGVYAAKKASLTTTGSVSFEAHNCKVRVLGSVAGAYDSTGTAATVNNLKDTENDSDGNEQGKVIEGAVNWEIGDVYFYDLNCSNDEIATPIEFTFKMTNESDYAVTANLNLLGDLRTNETITSTASFSHTTGLSYSNNMCVLNKNQTVTLKLKLVPTTDAKFDNINLENIKLNFEKTTSSTVAESQNLTLTYNTSQLTATAKMTSSSSSVSEITIPAAVLNSGTTYVVSEIESGAFQNNTSITNVVIQEGVRLIQDQAFYGCTNLSSVTIPSSVTHIKSGAFYGCTSLTNIVIPSNVQWIENNAFYGCTQLSSVEIPYGVNQIRSNAFAGCTNLTSIVIPSTVDTIYQNAFSGCTSLASITLSNNVSTIDNNAFQLCTSLSSIIIPNKVTEIRQGLFYGCSGLSSVTIPTSVTSIKSQVFSGCSSLSAITYSGTKAQWGAITLTFDWRPTTLTTVHCTDGDIDLTA